MSRLLPLFALLVLILVPAAFVPVIEPSRPEPTLPIAAPIPPEAKRRIFGENGFVTRDDLKQVRFDTRKMHDELSEDSFDLAVHMPWTKFTEGEPIPVYFVLRNNRNVPYLDSRRK